MHTSDPPCLPQHTKGDTLSTCNTSVKPFVESACRVSLPDATIFLCSYFVSRGVLQIKSYRRYVASMIKSHLLG